MQGEVIEAEFDRDANRLDYTVEFENGETAELTFSSKVGLHTVVSEQAMEQLAGMLPGTEVKEDVYDALKEAGEPAPEFSIAGDFGE